MAFHWTKKTELNYGPFKYSKGLHIILGYVQKTENVHLNQLFVSVDLVKATFRVNVNIMQMCLTDAFMNEIKNILLALERSSVC